ncbi:hypothetical protein GCM10027172_03630 [Halomonas garicola]
MRKPAVVVGAQQAAVAALLGGVAGNQLLGELVGKVGTLHDKARVESGALQTGCPDGIKAAHRIARWRAKVRRYD